MTNKDFIAKSQLDKLSPQKRKLFEALRKKQAEQSRVAAIATLAPDEPVLLSDAQQQALTMHWQNPQQSSQNLRHLVALSGPLDTQQVAQAFRQVIARHEILRTLYELQAGQFVCRIESAAMFEMAMFNVSDENAAIAQANRWFATPFELSKELPIRVALMSCHDTQHILAVNIHHVAADGRSVAIILQEFAQYYGQPAKPLTALPCQYKEFAKWARQRGDIEQQRQYWLNQLQDAPTLHSVIHDQPRPTVLTQAGAISPVCLSGELSEQLAERAKHLGVSQYALMFSLFALFVLTRSQERDVIIGTPLSTRQHPDVQGLVGYFVNVLPLRFRLSGGQSMGSWLSHCQALIKSALEHVHVPIAELVSDLHLVRDSSHAPLIQIMFSFLEEDFSMPSLDGLTMVPVEVSHDATDMELALNVVKTASGLTCYFEFNTVLFSHDLRMQLMAQWPEFVTTCLNAGEQTPLSQLPLQHQACHFPKPHPVKQTLPNVNSIVEYLPELIARYGDLPVYEGRFGSATYRQSYQCAQWVAAHLQQRGIKQGDNVAIHSQRRPDVLITMWGIWLCGAAIVPIDTTMPLSYKKQMLSCANVKLITGNTPLEDETLAVDFASSVDLQTPAEQPFSAVEVQPQTPAAIYFTSGSTGVPKGVVCHHQAYIKTMLEMADALSLREHVKVFQFSSIGFDVLLEELYLSWVVGGASCWVFEHSNIGIDELCDAIETYQVNIMETPTAFWHQWSTGVKEGRARVPECLDALLVGGEPVDPELCLSWPHQHCALYNIYGSTETAVSNIMARLSAQPGLEIAPIGMPFSSTEVYVLDDAQLPVPAGQRGELYMAGPAVGLGYLNAPQQQSERFVPDPIKNDGSIAFRTGDVVSYDEQGQLYCYGRKAFQVKLNGFSIEPNHIAKVLRGLAEVDEAQVMLLHRSDKRPQLVAFMVADEAERSRVTQGLAEQLPQYMLPQQYFFLPQMPINRNGKVDRKALEAHWQAHLTEAQETVLIGDDALARKLLAAWQQCLGEGCVIEPHSSFFTLGGSSIELIKLAMLLQQTFAVDVPVATLVHKQSFEAQYQWLQSQTCTQQQDLIRADLSQPIALSEAQQTLWFAQQASQDERLYRIVADFAVHGPLDLIALDAAYKSVVLNNPIYRSELVEIDGKICQQVKPHSHAMQVHQVPDAAQARAWIDNYHRSAQSSNMLELHTLSVSDTLHYLIFDVHHIITDEWSVNLLNAELMSAYQSLCEGQGVVQDSAQYNYFDFIVNAARRDKQAPDYQADMQRWRDKLSAIEQLCKLPQDKHDSGQDPQLGKIVSSQISTETLARLRTYASANQLTMNALMQALFSYTLSLFWGERTVNYAYMASLRDHAAWQSVQGYFIQTQWIQHEVDYHSSFTELARQVQANLSDQFAMHSLPLSEVLPMLPGNHVLRELRDIPIMFNYQQADNVVQQLSVAGLEIEYQRPDTHKAKFDLTVNLVEEQDALALHFDYRSALYSETLIRSVVETLVLLAERLVAQPDKRLCDVPVVDDETYRQLVITDNHSTAAVPEFNSLVAMFEHCADIMPEAIAVTELSPQTLKEGTSAHSVTYQQLNQQANQIARLLTGLGVAQEDRVVINLPSGVTFISCVLALHKLGATVIMADHEMPDARLSMVIEDAQAALLLSDEAEHRGPFACQSVSSAQLLAHSGSLATQNLEHEVSPQTPAYIIYTSGSTGRPKGILNHHLGLLNAVDYQSELFNIERGDSVLQYASVNFEGAIADIYMPLIRGARCCTFTLGQRADMQYLNALIQAHDINIVTMTPSAIPQLTPQTLSHIKSLLAAGEMLPLDTVNYAVQYTTVFNLYGPSECSLCTTIDCYDAPQQAVRLGRRVRNMAFYILNDARMLLPYGAIGEICITGMGVTLGYHNQPELSAQRFVRNTMDDRSQKMFCSGDLARAVGNGQIQFIGRNDEQLKINGQRIEVKEVESVLARHDAVQTAHIVVKEAQNEAKQLIAFVVLHNAQSTTSEALSAWLQTQLPAYMQPRRIWLVTELPYTPNGKLDKKKLLQQDEQHLQVSGSGTLTPTEQAVWQLWSGVLELDENSAHSEANFFNLGGNSLHLTKIVGVMNAHFATHMSMAEFLTLSTLADVATYFEDQKATVEELEW
ncbi:non-ribosomal peptide synthetase [Pseudoalteromonas rubra]|uniref:non-ribosomal peptide synthetase n=1 Tax=Pseudoalteromonas rubra TaxID=43658 RepID=UPI000F778760|nr:non-ribosomal peptide synthetase [Pseudoalteromonas rubra]